MPTRGLAGGKDPPHRERSITPTDRILQKAHVDSPTLKVHVAVPTLEARVVPLPSSMSLVLLQQTDRCAICRWCSQSLQVEVSSRIWSLCRWTPKLGCDQVDASPYSILRSHGHIGLCVLGKWIVRVLLRAFENRKVIRWRLSLVVRFARLIGSDTLRRRLHRL